ncbi:Yip1 family protein [Marinifilum sp. RC60d5]|uniref:Yip1 family protein n=1 Tax=Marinifilum sp. RC60d5 TaxID=3458414 RepID=UPI004036CEC8
MINIEYLIDRVKLVILNPKSAWLKISNEEVQLKDFLTSYILPLALIPTIASFIGYGLIGMGSYFKVASLTWGLHQAILAFLGAFLGVIISAFCIHKLAASFHTCVSLPNAVKLVGYAYTPTWLAGVFYMVPSLSILGLVAGIYSLYILYLGFVPITNVAEDKKINYFILSLVVVILVSALLSFLIGALLLGIGLSTY